MKKVCRVCLEEKEIEAFGKPTFTICRRCNNQRNINYSGFDDWLGDPDVPILAKELLKNIGYDPDHPTMTIHQQFLERNAHRLKLKKPLD